MAKFLIILQSWILNSLLFVMCYGICILQNGPCDSVKCGNSGFFCSTCLAEVSRLSFIICHAFLHKLLKFGEIPKPARLVMQTVNKTQ